MPQRNDKVTYEYLVKIKSKVFPDLYHLIEVDLFCSENISAMDLVELFCFDKINLAEL